MWDRRWAGCKRKNAAGAGWGSTFLPGHEFREEGRTKKSPPTEAGMSMKKTAGKMPEKKSENVGHLGIFQGLSSDICARFSEKPATIRRFTQSFPRAARWAKLMMGLQPVAAC